MTANTVRARLYESLFHVRARARERGEERERDITEHPQRAKDFCERTTSDELSVYINRAPRRAAPRAHFLPPSHLVILRPDIDEDIDRLMRGTREAVKVKTLDLSSRIADSISLVINDACKRSKVNVFRLCQRKTRSPYRQI